MAKHERGERPVGWLAGDALPCVWMMAGLLTYKLCDRNYECDTCPLDAALVGGREAAATRSGEARREWAFPEGRIYAPTHTWAEARDEGEVRVGVDALAAHLIGRVTAAVLPRVGSRVRQGTIAVWLEDEGEMIAVASPVTGRVIRVNGTAQARPCLVHIDPYRRGWLYDVILADDVGTLQLLSGEDMDRLSRRQIEDLVAAARSGDGGHGGLGPTLADGGQVVGNLRQLLGGARYRRLVHCLFH